MAGVASMIAGGFAIADDQPYEIYYLLLLSEVSST